MKVLLTGACGFVGSTLAQALIERVQGIEIVGMDNLSRAGSERNRSALQALHVDLRHGDVRVPSDFEQLPPVEWVIDAAANPSVLAGVDGTTSSRQLIEHNLYGTVNLLEFCKAHKAGFILLSTSRVYSIADLAAIPVEHVDDAFRLETGAPLPPGVSPRGVSERFSTAPPLSLYGVAKASSELLALEYADAFGFTSWINRCGVLGGAGQFGRRDQGIFAFWINAWLRRRPLSYIGFGGTGAQVRDCLHPRDLAPLLARQMTEPAKGRPRTVNLGGGLARALSLRQLSAWCERRFGPHEVRSHPETRQFDVPWLVMDASLADTTWQWRPDTPLDAILDEIARHAELNPGWLEISGER